MLEPSELRILREIERGLRTDDPAFAERIDAGARSFRWRFGHLYTLMAVGVAVTLCGPMAPGCYSVGLAIALTGLSVRLVMSWLDRRGVAADDRRDRGDPGPGEVPI